MPVVHSIKKKRYSKKYFVNFKDDSESIILSLDIIMKFNINKDKNVNEDILEKALEEQSLEDCKSAAYTYVSYKPRTEFEIRKRLEEKDFTQNHIEQAITFLNEFDLIDDEAFAKSFISTHLKKKPAGKFKIKTELVKRGIDKDLAEKMVENYYPSDQVYDLAIEAGKTKLRKVNHKKPEKQEKSVTDYLARNGFNWDIIKQVKKELFK